MADNTVQNGTDTIATDDLAFLNGGAVSGFKVQRVKDGWGVDGTQTDVTLLTALPIQSGQSTTGTITGPASTGTTSFSVLALNTARKGATFFNGTNVDILLALAATSATTAYTIRVLAGGYYELPGMNVVYTGIVTGLPVGPGGLTPTGSTSGTLTVTELT